MKYLNDLNTGKLIRINKISDSGIYYSIYENKVFANSGLFPENKRIDNSINEIEVNHGGTIADLKMEVATELLSITETDFTVNEDEQNWFIVSGSTGLTSIRITIPNHAYDSALKDKDNPEGNYYPLWQVIAFATETINAQFAQITYNAIVQYLCELLPEHQAILEMYSNEGVVIENKI